MASTPSAAPESEVVWTDISDGLSGDLISISADPYDHNTKFVQTTTGVYRGNPFVFSGWTLVIKG